MLQLTGRYLDPKRNNSFILCRRLQSPMTNLKYLYRLAPKLFGVQHSVCLWDLIIPVVFNL